MMKLTPAEILIAREVLMTGPRATPPTMRAVRKIARYLRDLPKGAALDPNWRCPPWRRLPRYRTERVAM